MTRARIDPMCLTHRAHRPHYESDPYRPSPARREHIHGPIEPMDREERSTFWSLIVVAAVVATFALSFIEGMMR